MFLKFIKKDPAYASTIFLFLVCFVLTSDNAFSAETATPSANIVPQPKSVAKECAEENETCGTIAGIQCCPGLECKLASNRIDSKGKCINALKIKAEVYVYPDKLTTKDKLSFHNEQNKTITIKGETMLVYVDLYPDAKFEHDTQCILISPEEVKVINGKWWLVLNGKAIFHDRERKKFRVDFPVNLSE